MTLATAPRRRGMTVVRPPTVNVKPPAALAARLAAAQAAVAGPRQRVDELESALTAAVGASDYARAAKIQQQLPAAREALALAEIDLRVIEEQQKALTEAEEAERRVIAEAQRRDRARTVIEASGDAEAQAQAEIDAALDDMRSHLAAARVAYQRALAAEAGILGLRQRAAQATFELGEVGPPPNPFGEKRPPPIGPPAVWAENRATVLQQDRPLIAELARWQP